MSPALHRRECGHMRCYGAGRCIVPPRASLRHIHGEELVRWHDPDDLAVLVWVLDCGHRVLEGPFVMGQIRTRCRHCVGAPYVAPAVVVTATMWVEDCPICSGVCRR